MNEPWLTKSELARKLRISTRTIERLRIKPDMQVGGQNRWTSGAAFVSSTKGNLARKVQIRPLAREVRPQREAAMGA
jgi:hypothetical protein